LVGVALGDPLACDGQACMVENDQAALLQSSILNKGEESGLFCQQAKDYLCYQKTGLPACCSDGRRNTCGTVKPPCDKMRKKGKGKGKGKSSSPGSWGPNTDNTYCNAAHSLKDSRKAAKSACKRDEACGGIYQPASAPGKWLLCQGFDTSPSTANNIVIKKLGGSWGPKTDNTYCNAAHSLQDSRKAAKSACKRDEECGGIYQPASVPGKWLLCQGFDTSPSTANNIVIKKLGGPSKICAHPEQDVYDDYTFKGHTPVACCDGQSPVNQHGKMLCPAKVCAHPGQDVYDDYTFHGHTPVECCDGKQAANHNGKMLCRGGDAPI